MTEPAIERTTATRPTGPRPVRVNEASEQAEAARIAAFGREIDALRSEVEQQLGQQDSEYIARIGKLSERLELLGRGLLYVSLDPLTFALGTSALWAHKTLELMEIGHMALHGAYDSLPDNGRFQSRDFRWKAPIDEASWKSTHNVRHHQYTNIEGRDPDLNFGALRLSPRVPYRWLHALQPISNLLTWAGFATAINLHVTGMLDLYVQRGELQVLDDAGPETVHAAQHKFLSKWLRYYTREYGLFPLLAGPFFPKVLLGNLLSELGRDLYAAAIIYCGHVGARDFPNGTEPASRAHWYAMQVEAARDVELPTPLSILCGALDLQIEHHLFPRLPPNRLRQIAPRVRAICEAHGVAHKSQRWPAALREVFGELRQLASRDAAPLPS